jgi:phosphoglycolate phosphatase
MINDNLPKAVVFDLDGTLINSAGQVASILNDLRVELGKPIMPVSSYVPWISLGGVCLIKNGLGVTDDQAPELLNKFREIYKNKPTPLDSLIPCVREVLADLKCQGIKICICTNKPRSLALKVLNELNIYKFFDYVNAGGDLPKPKPHPDNLHACLNAVHCEADHSIMVGDSLVDQNLANSCEVPFAWYSAGNDDGVIPHQVEFSFECFSQFVKKLNKINFNQKMKSIELGDITCQP